MGAGLFSADPARCERRREMLERRASKYAHVYDRAAKNRRPPSNLDTLLISLPPLPHASCAGEGRRNRRNRAGGVPDAPGNSSENNDDDSDAASSGDPDAPLDYSESSGDSDAASDWSSAGGTSGYRDSGSTTTGASSRSRSSSPLKVTRRPVQLFRGGGGGALISGGASSVMESRSGSFSPGHASRIFWKRESLSSLDSSFSESFSDGEDRRRQEQGWAGSGGHELGGRRGSPAETDARLPSSVRGT